MGRRSTITMLLAAPGLLVAPLLVAAAIDPTSIDWRHLQFEPELQRDHALAGRADEPRAEMEFLAQYERLRVEPPPFEAVQGREAAFEARVVPCTQELANRTHRPIDVADRRCGSAASR